MAETCLREAPSPTSSVYAQANPPAQGAGPLGAALPASPPTAGSQSRLITCSYCMKKLRNHRRSIFSLLRTGTGTTLASTWRKDTGPRCVSGSACSLPHFFPFPGLKTNSWKSFMESTGTTQPRGLAMSPWPNSTGDAAEGHMVLSSLLVPALRVPGWAPCGQEREDLSQLRAVPALQQEGLLLTMT